MRNIIIKKSQTRLKHRTVHSWIIFLQRTWNNMMKINFVTSQTMFFRTSIMTTGSDFSQKRLMQSARFDSCEFFLARNCVKKLRNLLLCSNPVSLNSPYPQLSLISMSSHEWAKSIWSAGEIFGHLLSEFWKLFNNNS